MVGPKKVLNLTTWHDFTVQQEHLFLKSIYSSEDFLKMENLKTLNDGSKVVDLKKDFKLVERFGDYDRKK